MFNILIGLLISIMYSFFFLPRKEYKEPILKPTLYPLMYKGMIILPYTSKKAFHIHHWIIYLLIFTLSFFIYIPQILMGFSFGLFIQGICYKDCFILTCNNPYNY